MAVRKGLACGSYVALMVPPSARGVIIRIHGTHATARAVQTIAAVHTAGTAAAGEIRDEAVGAKGTELLHNAFVPAELRLDVHDLPEPKKPPTPPGQPQGQPPAPPS